MCLRNPFSQKVDISTQFFIAKDSRRFITKTNQQIYSPKVYFGTKKRLKILYICKTNMSDGRGI